MSKRSYINLTATTDAIVTGPGRLLGFYVNSTSSGTLVLYDSAAHSSGAFTGTITPAVGWHGLTTDFSTGFSVVVGATINVTFCFE